MKRKIIIVALILVVTNLPYLIALFFQNEGLRFGGFLLNPTDGYSYLAKMQIGQMGDWKFTLLYSPPGGNGAYVFLFYIVLGHLSRLMGVSSILLFHGARVIASVMLLIASERLCSWAIKDQLIALRAWILVSTGAGMGWLALLVVGQTADFWVAEAYPWLSMFSSPHFTLGLAIVCWILPQLFSTVAAARMIVIFLMGFMLAGIMPFAVVVVGVVVAAAGVWHFSETKRMDFRPSLTFFTPAIIYLTYQFFVITNDPYLAAWNRQNVTNAPPLWDFIAAFSPALILAVVGVIISYRSDKSVNEKVFISWLMVGAVLVYIPFALQRRFMFGYYIPIAILAIISLDRLRYFLRYSSLLIIISMLTNLVLIFIVTFGIINHSDKYFFHRDWIPFFDCIQASTRKGDTIIAPASIGLLVPAFTGRHVVSGHPMESVNAVDMDKVVFQFYQGDISLPQVESACMCDIQYSILPIRPMDHNSQSNAKTDIICSSDDLVLVTRTQ